MKSWPRYPVIYEINTWVWLQELSEEYKSPVTLAKVRSEPRGAGESSSDFIFLDILLPGVDGLQLAQKIRKDFPNIRIAMLTNYDLPASRRTAAKFGVDRYFIKDSLNGEEIKEWVGS